MAPLWDGYFRGGAADAAVNHTVTCCSKWAAADRHSTPYKEWEFEYDHVFLAGRVKPDPAAATPVRPLPYRYPGTATPCADAACTGEDPPANTTATHQGSWHRGWAMELAYV